MIGVNNVTEGFDVEVRHAIRLQDVNLTDTLTLLVILIKLVCALLHNHTLALLATTELLFSELKDLVFVAILLSYLYRWASVELLVKRLDHICRPSQSGTNFEARISHTNCLRIYLGFVWSFIYTITIISENLRQLIALLFENGPAESRDVAIGIISFFHLLHHSEEAATFELVHGRHHGTLVACAVDTHRVNIPSLLVESKIRVLPLYGCRCSSLSSRLSFFGVRIRRR